MEFLDMQEDRQTDVHI